MRHRLGWIVAIVIAAAIGGGSTFALVSTVDHNEQKISNTEDVASIANDAIVRQCRLDRVFRLQYRQRGIVEKRALRIERRVNDALRRVAVLATQGGSGANPLRAALGRLNHVTNRANRLLAKLGKRIKIRPVPKCADLRRRLAVRPPP